MESYEPNSKTILSRKKINYTKKSAIQLHAIYKADTLKFKTEKLKKSKDWKRHIR
jgi:hypothetical protein